MERARKPTRGPRDARARREIGLRPEMLVSARDRDLARALFWRVLMREQNWRPAPDDPAGLHMATGPCGPMLCDDYDGVSTLFGVWRDDTLIAAHRVSPPLGGVFHLERYRHVVPERFKTTPTFELTRLAVDRAGRGTWAVFDLLRYEFEWLQAQQATYCFTTAAFPHPGRLYLRLGMKQEPISEFTFRDTDPRPVCLLFAEIARASDSALWGLTRRRAVRCVATEEGQDRAA